MAMGIPVITNSGVGDTDFIIEKYQSGALIPDFGEENYCETVSRIEDLLNFDKNFIRKGAIDFFSIEKGIAKYLSMYQKLIK